MINFRSTEEAEAYQDYIEYLPKLVKLIKQIEGIEHEGLKKVILDDLMSYFENPVVIIPSGYVRRVD